MRLGQRLSKLEAGMMSSDAVITTIVREIVAADEGKPRDPQPEVIGAGIVGSDWHLSRNPGESVEDFTERATASAPRDRGGFASILIEYAK